MPVYIVLFMILRHLFIQTRMELKYLFFFSVHIPPQTPFLFTTAVMNALRIQYIQYPLSPPCGPSLITSTGA